MATTKEQDVTKVSGSETNARWVVFGLLSIILWHILLPIFVPLFVIYKTDFQKRTKIIVALLSFIVLEIVGASFLYNALRQPTLTVLEPENNVSIQSNQVVIKGEFHPARAKLYVDGMLVDTQGGAFSYVAKLPKEINTVELVVKNNFKSTSTSLVLNRIFTDEEKKQIAQEKERIEAEAQALADKQAKERQERIAEHEQWLASPAGKACTLHPEWTKEDCDGIASSKIWVGMHYDMLVYMWGKPTSANPSNYGSGTRWQWCWSGYTPSCFYDNDGDRLIDAYN